MPTLKELSVSWRAMGKPRKWRDYITRGSTGRKLHLHYTERMSKLEADLKKAKRLMIPEPKTEMKNNNTYHKYYIPNIRIVDRFNYPKIQRVKEIVDEIKQSNFKDRDAYFRLGVEWEDQDAHHANEPYRRGTPFKPYDEIIKAFGDMIYDLRLKYNVNILPRLEITVIEHGDKKETYGKSGTEDVFIMDGYYIANLTTKTNCLYTAEYISQNKIRLDLTDKRQIKNLNSAGKMIKNRVSRVSTINKSFSIREDVEKLANYRKRDIEIYTIKE